MAKNDIETVFSAEAIDRRVRELGNEIRKDAGDREVFLLGILKGTSCFLADLIRAIPGELGYGFIDVARDQADTKTASALEIDFVTFTDIAGKQVYVLKDVVSTGVIESYLLSQLRIHNPAAVRLVTLLDRTASRTIDLLSDFRAFDAGEGTYVGYGLEWNGRHGNLPYIGRIRH